ncbi:MAG TPA: hypothetical protein VMT42_06310 [candidate division Zixibacteria bacterium]|nr:hypothetical protein [candidate division Zixibacteria bacterium]
MKNHSDFKENIQKLYKHMLLTGSERQITLYDLGDTRIELSTQESKCVSSLFRLGCLWLLTRHSKDYLSQYLLGKAVSTMIPVFSLVKSRSLGESLQERFLWAYEKSDKSVLEKLVENSKSIGKDTFDEFFYPSLDGDNYLLMAEKYLGDCVEMKKLMAQNNAWPSLVKANGAVKMHAARKRDLLYYTRNLRYIS